MRLIKIGFWGTGNMAKAMVRGLLKSGCLAENIFCISKSGTTAKLFAEETGIQHLDTSKELINACDCLVLAFKPHQLEELKDELEAANNTVIVSVLAAISLAKLRLALPLAKNVVRTMPNTPGKVGQGITAFCTEDTSSQELELSITTILNSLGEVIQIEETLMDSFTAVAGSGPAYVFEFIAALASAGEKEGLPSDLALAIAKQTVLGAAYLAKEANDHPEELRNQVTSKGGVTQAGLKALSDGNFRSLICKTVKAAKVRSIEMGKN